MGMTIDEAISMLDGQKDWYETNKTKAIDVAIETMRKYQKIVDIYYHQSGRALEDSLREVIEHGRYSTED